MFRTILIFGLVAGVLVAGPLFTVVLISDASDGGHSELVGYLIMLVALSLIFVGVKRLRDREFGGVIGFGRALMAGLGISVVASVVYVIGWEITLNLTHYAFADSYAAAMIRAAQARGASAADLARVTAEMAAFKTQYANPLYRLPMTFIEVFPVGLLISLISAGLLRNRRFLPAQVLAT